MPRLKSKDVLAQAINAGATSKDFFGTAYGQSNGKFEGFALGGGSVVFDDALILIEPEAARAYEEANRPTPQPGGAVPDQTKPAGTAQGYPVPGKPPAGGMAEPGVTPGSPAVAKVKSFFGAARKKALTTPLPAQSAI